MNWGKSPLVWRYGSTEYISVVFTWDLPKAKEIYKQRSIGIEKKYIGGPAVNMFPEYFNDCKEAINHDFPYSPGQILRKYNPFAGRSSIGCPNKCGFCAVKKIHPKFKEFKILTPIPIICDDNLLACSRKHFDMVIDKQKCLNSCDFNQGLDASLLTRHHANRFAELKNPLIRLAWDDVNEGSEIERAILYLRKAGIPRRNIRCYVLIGYNDTPENALYRLESLYYLFGIKPNPMRYQPFSGIHCLTKNSYVHPNWTKELLDKFMSYWSNIRFTGGVPFNEYVHHKKPPVAGQLGMDMRIGSC
jgi:hypothetical protein